MQLLVTGGSGVIGAGLLPELLSRGHTVRLLTRHAGEDVREWPDEVEPFAGDVTVPEELDGAADGCDVVVHISGIVAEQPPDITFDRVNVQGTRNLLAEAVRAGKPRFIYLSSLGADRGSSAYHASKREAEKLVRRYRGRWAILRPGAVYGPGDEVVSNLLRMHRTMPVIPVIGLGDHQFQPIFYADLGAAIAAAAERHTVTGVYELAGADITTPAEILGQFAVLTGREPIPIPIPETVVGAAVRIAGAAGIPLPIDEAKFQMLIEHNVITPPSKNALLRVFGVEPTPLAEGLRFLVDAQLEQCPEEGVGPLERKRFWADIHGGSFGAEDLMAAIRERCTELMAVEFSAEPDTPQEIAEGVSLTASLPLRGNIQVRVAEVTPTSFTFVTLKGHPLAGAVRFEAEDISDAAVRFAITVSARAATIVDWFAVNTVGRVMQDQNWTTVVERVIDLGGGESDGVHVEHELCDSTTASSIEEEIAGLVSGYKRRAHSALPGG